MKLGRIEISSIRKSIQEIKQCIKRNEGAEESWSFPMLFSDKETGDLILLFEEKFEEKKGRALYGVWLTGFQQGQLYTDMGTDCLEKFYGRIILDQE